MKRMLSALLILTFLFTASASNAAAEPSSDSTTVLPMTDDAGKNWVLKNLNENYRVKWSISTDGPYDHFNGMKINDHTIILRNFEGVFAVNENGQILWKQNAQYPEWIAGADGSLFTVSSEFKYKDDKATVSKTDATRMDLNGGVLSRYTGLPLALVKEKGFLFIKDTFYAGDSKGNFVALLDKGLTSLRPDGSIQWQLNELKFNQTSYDVLKMSSLLADKKGNVLVGIDGQVICVNAENGNVMWVVPHTLDRFSRITGTGLLDDGGFYEITKEGLRRVTDPDILFTENGRAIDHQGGYYKVDEKKGMLMNVNLKSDQVQWSYSVSAQELAMGYTIVENYGQNLVSDPLGNVYVSTNGGTVHAIDQKGNLRFSLMITNRIMGFSQIIPMSNNAVVIINNRHVVCLEKVEQPSDNHSKNISLSVNGQEKRLEHKPIFQDGRVRIALREIFEMLGAEVKWDPETAMITAVKDDRKVVMQIGSKEAEVNGSATVLDAGPELVGEVTYVPIRLVSEALGYQVTWDETNQSVRITTMN